MTNPFVGPNPLSGENRLFGRSREVRELLYLLTSERIVLLYSPSGAGKSSLLNARGGLIERLKEHFLVWRPARMILAGAAPEGVNRYTAGAVDWWEDEREERNAPAVKWTTLSEYVQARRSAENVDDAMVLIFDQFEEILRVDPTGVAAKTGFFRELGELLRDPLIWALLVIREDYLAPLDPYRQHLPTLLSNRYRMDLMKADQAREAMANTAQEGGREFAPDALDALVRDLSKVYVRQPDDTLAEEVGEYVEPMQLQVVCRNLWERIEPPGETRISATHVAQFGNVAAALGEHYDQSVAAIAGGDFAVEWEIRRWMGEKLIKNGIRSQVQREAGKSDGLDNALVQQLDDRHLIRAEVHGGGKWYELAHDRLIRPVLDSNAAWLNRKLTDFERRALLWEKEESESLLLVDRELAEAPAQPLIDVSAFLAACRKRQKELDRERRQERRMKWALAGLSALFLVAAIVAVLAVRYSREAARNLDLATARGLVAAQDYLEGDAEQLPLRALLSLESLRFHPSPEAWQKLRTIVPVLAKPVFETPKLKWIVGLAFRPDGKQLAVADANGLYLFPPGVSRRLDSEAFGLAYSPDGKLLAATRRENVCVYEVDTGQRTGCVDVGWRGAFMNPQFHPRLPYLVVRYNRGFVFLDQRAGKIVKELPLQKGAGDPVDNALAYSPNGNLTAIVDGQRQMVSYFNSDFDKPWPFASQFSLGLGFGVDQASATADGHVVLAREGGWAIVDWRDPTKEGPVHEANLGSGVRHSVISGDSRWIAVSMPDSQEVRVYETETTRQVASIGIPGKVDSLAIDPVRHQVAIGRPDGIAQVYEFLPGEWRPALKWTWAQVNPNRVRRVMTLDPPLALRSDESYVRLADIETRAVRWTGKTEGGQVVSAALSPNGAYVGAVVVRGTTLGETRIWSVANNTSRVIPYQRRLMALDSSGKFALLNSPVQVAEIDGGKLVSPKLEGARWGAFHPDGSSVVLATANEARVVSTKTWQTTARFRVAPETASVAFSPDGTKLVVGRRAESGNEALVFDLARPMAAPAVFTMPLDTNDVQLTRDGKTVVGLLPGVETYYFPAHIIEGDPLIRAACGQLTRNLSRSEWKEYIGTFAPYRKTCPELPEGK